ncbi:MAG: hypothetical protein FE046_01085 [Thermoplasmata archaeon]|nr:MAG: hypothetical protein FE046_01085 [Thermoplasmata archaeon]RLF60798.1 MAG: hypothetical protein DRN37_02125 [Thermoplasmata archaeon]
MALEQKGMLSPFTIFTSIITGGFFPLLGSFFAALFLDRIYWTGVALTSIGGFLAHYLLSHTIHDIFHYDIESRRTLSKNALKTLLGVSLAVLLFIAFYLTYQSGWPVMVFSVIGALTCMYAEGLIHHESQMAFGAMFLVIGAFYVQMGYFMNMDEVFSLWKEWLEVTLLSLFAFFSQYGWLLFYRLDDYGWDPKKRNESILMTKIGLIFLVALFGVHALL